MSLLKRVMEWSGPRRVYLAVPEDEKSLPPRSNDDEDLYMLSRERAHTAKLHRLLYTLIALAATSFVFFAALTLVNWKQVPKFKTPVPHIPLETRTFYPDPGFEGPPSKENDKLWWDMFPGNSGGFISLQDPDRYDLPPGVTTPEGIQNYGISAFHQLHCLLLIRDWYFKFLTDDGSRELAKDPKSKVAAEIKHTGHCFDYIRWNIMCSADMTVEWAKIENGTDINGVGVPHKQCKNWDAVTDFMLEHLPGKSTRGHDHGHAHP